MGGFSGGYGGYPPYGGGGGGYPPYGGGYPSFGGAAYGGAYGGRSGGYSKGTRGLVLLLIEITVTSRVLKELGVRIESYPRPQLLVSCTDCILYISSNI